MLKNLSIAMVQVRGFVKENRGSLTRNIAGLNRVSKVLVKRRDVLDETLRDAPAALNNLYLAGNQKEGTLDTRNNADQVLSSLEEDPLADSVRPRQPEPHCDAFEGQAAPAPRSTPFSGAVAEKPRVPEPIDRSLGGLVEVTR